MIDLLTEEETEAQRASDWTRVTQPKNEAARSPPLNSWIL